MDRLVTLSQERIEQELKRQREIDAVERLVRARIRKYIAAATACYVVGLFLLASSLHVNGEQWQLGLFGLGVVIGDITPLAIWYFVSTRDSL